MKRKRISRLLVLLLGLQVLSSCSRGPGSDNASGGQTPAYTRIQKERDGPVYIMTATDLHYLSPRLNSRGSAVRDAALLGDGKVVQYSDYITEALLEQVIYQEPDILVLSGDLTYNGERLSHLDLADLLRRLTALDIPVAVLPGNHDISIPFALNYSGEIATPTETISYEEFHEIYGEFGYDSARLKDPTSFSYLVEMRNDIWLILLDANSEKARGRLSNPTKAWLTNTLEESKKKGKTVISVTHQALNDHNDHFTDGFVIENREEILSIFEKYDVLFNLAGHMHIQHKNISLTGFSEIVTGALSVSPHNSGHVLIAKDLDVSYQTQPLDVSGWAARNGILNEDLFDFTNYSKNFFTEICYNKVKRQLINDPTITERELQKLLTFAAKTNAAYFAGDLCLTCEDLDKNAGYLLWKEKASNFSYFDYMQSYLSTPQSNQNKADFSIAPHPRL